jgi:uncharacterized protein YjbI with pentapeptide repeats
MTELEGETITSAAQTEGGETKSPVPAMPSLSDIPKPPSRRTVIEEPKEPSVMATSSAAPPPDMMPARPTFAAPMPPTSLPSSVEVSPVAPPPMMQPSTPPVLAFESEVDVDPLVIVPAPPPLPPKREEMLSPSSTSNAPSIVQAFMPQQALREEVSETDGSLVDTSLAAVSPLESQKTLEPLEDSAASAATLPSESAPVSVITQGVFGEVLRQHTAWLETEGKEGRRANLSGLDLSNIDFSGANLQQANLRGTILRGVNLSTALLVEADLAEADMSRVTANGCNWMRINLASANLHGAILDGINLSFANALGADFSEVSMKNASLQSINLREASLRAADFTDADLSEAICRGADASRARFIRTIMTRADMRETFCHACDFVETVMQGVNFRNAEFDDTPFSYADFSVAIDIPLEYQSAGFQIEKDNIQQEKTELKQMELAIQQKQHEVLAKQSEVMEMKLQMEEQRNLILSLKADENMYIEGLKKIRKRLKIVRLFWLFVLVALVGITGLTIASMPLDQLNVLELGVIFIVPVGVLLLILFTLGQVSSALKRVDHHSMIRERKISGLQQNSESTAKRFGEVNPSLSTTQ